MKAYNKSLSSLQVPVNERALWQVHIHNHGGNNFEYRWQLSARCQKKGKGNQDLVLITPEAGVVLPHDRADSDLVFSPATRTSLDGCDLTLHVSTL